MFVSEAITCASNLFIYLIQLIHSFVYIFFGSIDKGIFSHYRRVTFFFMVIFNLHELWRLLLCDECFLKTGILHSDKAWVPRSSNIYFDLAPSVFFVRKATCTQHYGAAQCRASKTKEHLRVSRFGSLQSEYTLSWIFMDVNNKEK